VVIRAFQLLWPKPLIGKTVVALVFASVVLGAAFQWSIKAAECRLADAWRLSEEFGLPNEFEPLLGEPVPSRDNAGFPLDEATSVAKKHIAAEEKRLKTEDVEVLLRDSSFIASMSQLLSDNPYESHLADADRRPSYSSRVVRVRPLFMSDVDHLKDRRCLATAEQAIAKQLASQGRREESIHRLLRMIRLTRRWEDREPFLVVALVNVSIRGRLIQELNLVLRRGPLPPAVHDAVEAELSKTEAVLNALPRIAQFEKLSSIEYRDIFPVRGNAFLVNAYADDDRAFMIRHIHELARTYDRQYFEASDEIRRSESAWLSAINDPVRRYMYHGTRFLLPAMKLGRIAFDRLIATSRCGRIVNAMAQRADFKLELHSLGLPAQCLVDPFDGKPLRIRRTTNGPVVYSVLEDQKDDGGIPGGGKDLVLAPPSALPESK
jgi:hypothetical protein